MFVSVVSFDLFHLSVNLQLIILSWFFLWRIKTSIFTKYWFCLIIFSRISSSQLWSHSLTWTRTRSRKYWLVTACRASSASSCTSRTSSLSSSGWFTIPPVESTTVLQEFAKVPAEFYISWSAVLTDDKRSRREARVLRWLEELRAYSTTIIFPDENHPGSRVDGEPKQIQNIRSCKGKVREFVLLIDWLLVLGWLFGWLTDW